MSGYVEAKAAREWQANNTPEARIARDKCPRLECDGDLDTGFECEKCGFDPSTKTFGWRP